MTSGLISYKRKQELNNEIEYEGEREGESGEEKIKKEEITLEDL
jgi:hypothetical protein